MSEPAPRVTIRVGQEMFDDVQDYVLLIRDKDNKVVSRTSSFCWAHGAMEHALSMIHARNQEEAYGEGDEE